MRRLVIALVVLGVAAAPAAAHKGNPDYETLVNKIEGVNGLKVQVVNGDDSLQLVNEGSQPVVVEGYDNEPYARLNPNGVVEVNQRSNATYLNEDRYGGGDIPAIADPKADPQWKVVARNGRFTFHDHRIHWMNQKQPPKIADEAKRQKVFDWKVPIVAGATTGSIDGTLWWRGKEEGAPMGAYIAGGVLLLASGLLVFLVRRRRRGAEPATAGSEAW